MALLNINVIHYNNESLIKTDEIRMRDVSLEVSSSGVWTGKGMRIFVLELNSNTMLQKSQSASLVINASASGNIDINLPLSPESGLNYSFITASNNTMDVISGDNSILFSSGTLASGISLGSLGSKLSVVYVGPDWVATKQFGSLTSL